MRLGFSVQIEEDASFFLKTVDGIRLRGEGREAAAQMTSKARFIVELKEVSRLLTYYSRNRL